MRAETALQNEDAVRKPPQKNRRTTSLKETRNLYFGDTHVHTALSFDSYLSGNRIGLREAYQFANGEPLTLSTGERLQLSQALDFVVMTDHAEGFGLFVTCGREGLNPEQREFCQSLDRPNKKLFKLLRSEGEKRPPQRPQALYAEHPQTSKIDAQSTWGVIVATADEFNKPGEFTAFAGYEYSPPLPMNGKVHRNVIFKNSETPDHAVSAFDADTVLNLWRSLESSCSGECDFLTIPHNMNKTWGLAYSGMTIDGDQYTDKDWALRGRNEPLAEIFQIKGSSECGYDVGASDEECNFELNVPVCDGEEVPGCSGRTSFAREGLKIGLELETKLGFNPIQTGFIGSTDAHNSNPGDTEEYDYRGASAEQESPARKRLGLTSGLKAIGKQSPNLVKNPGGLAAVWARENTREAIFDAMRKREVYATSGGRIYLRFFAGWDYPKDILEASDILETAYSRGVPMGSDLTSAVDGAMSPEFLVWAAKDPSGGNLQRVQMVKGWIAGGKTMEQVYDIACSDGLDPDPITNRCADNGAKVNLKTCATSANKGDAEIMVKWKDPEFDSKQSSFYYTRVLENPSCRWNTYDAIRLGIEPVANLPATMQERAWSSAIWYKP
ncbi:MAG: hypothetical protein ACI8UP_004472 [Porticoccaceae bacterium]